MKTKYGIMALAAGSVTLIIGAIVKNHKDIADKFSMEYSLKKAKDDITDDDKAVVDELYSMIDKSDNIHRKEKQQLNIAVDDFKEAAGYFGMKKRLAAENKSHMESFKESLHYDSKIKEADMEYENTILSYKKAHDYDDMIGELEDKISDAKDVYDRQIRMLDFVDGSEQSEEVKKAAKKVKKAAIKDAEEKIEKLENELNSIISEAEKKKEQKLYDLEKLVADEESRITLAAEEEIRKVEKRIADFREEKRKDILLKRPDEDIKVLEKTQELTNMADAIERKINDTAVNKYNEMSSEEKLARYYIHREIPVQAVWVVGMVPVICAVGVTGLLLWEIFKVLSAYIKYLDNVTKQMKGVKR